MGDREGSPERITDLLRQDDYMFDDEAPTPTAERAQSNKDAAFGGATNGPTTQTSNASKRIPIPIPKPAATASAPNGNGVASEGAAGAAPASMSELLGSGPRRFFIIKSNTAFNIDLSVEHGVWATQVGATLLNCHDCRHSCACTEMVPFWQSSRSPCCCLRTCRCLQPIVGKQTLSLLSGILWSCMHAFWALRLAMRQLNMLNMQQRLAVLMVARSRACPALGILAALDAH